MALLEINENSRILNFAKSPKIGNLRKFKHAKITRSTVYSVQSVHVPPVCIGVLYIKSRAWLRPRLGTGEYEDDVIN